MAPEETSVEQVEDLLRYDARKALEQARAHLDVSDAGSDDVTYQRWLLIKGAAQASLGATEDGARILREVRVWAEEHDDRTLQALSHRRLSALFRRIGDPALMLEHGVTAVDLLPEDTDEAVRGDHLLGLADALGASGSFEDSIRRYEEASALADKCGDRWLQLAVLNNLAYTQYEAGLSAEAVTTAERLRTEFESDGLKLRTHDGDTIARAYCAVGRYADAAAVIEPLIEDPATGEDCDGLVLALLTLTDVRRRSGEFEAAQSSLDRATRLAEHYALTGRMIEAMNEQAELHAARGDYQEAFETYRDFHRADVEMRAMERDGRARTLHAIFEATEARRSSEHFRELADRDPLTGLHNRRYVDEPARRRCSRRRRPRHAADRRRSSTSTTSSGSTTRRRTPSATRCSARSRCCCRRRPTASRAASRPGWAARSSCCCSRAWTATRGIARLDRLRATIAAHPWADVGEGVTVTASIGVASAPADEVERAALLAIADRNLYRAKRGGRDQVSA